MYYYFFKKKYHDFWKIILDTLSFSLFKKLVKNINKPIDGVHVSKIVTEKKIGWTMTRSPQKQTLFLKEFKKFDNSTKLLNSQPKPLFDNILLLL